ncbi:MAG: GH116 family glycosyl-hydrolase [Verrucomicrobia bacterium]|nr:GH116 family glycosyl-hydrolase [Verrucomicrobiota bacterium]
MPDENCCCGGRCRPPLPPELTRRKFLHTVAVGTAGIAAGNELLRAQAAAIPPAAALTTPKLPKSWRYPLTPPRVYRGANLEAVSMPIGGIGTGTVWLDGQGRLGVWQIFNNLSETRVPDSFFAVRVKSGDKPAMLRVLQTVPEEPLTPVASLTYEGGYPIARLDFSDPALPVALRLEAFNPLIPTDTANSSIPCAIFRFTARNTSSTPVELSLIGACQNAIGSNGSGTIKGVKFSGYGRNRNRAVREAGMTAIAMEKAAEPVPTCPVKVRGRTGEVVPGPEMFFFSELPALSPPAAETLVRIAKTGGVAIASAVSPSFFANLAALRGNPKEMKKLFTVFEDFEKPNYDGWTVTGEAFGKAPSTGTHAGQQRVSGFAGKRLVNTFLPNDKPQGTLTSKKFTIEKRYIGFLIGGGGHKGETCMNLRVGGKVVRTATGKNREQLEPASWDVAEFKGREAVIEIVDRHSGGWGHINVDQIVFSDITPDAILTLGSPVRAAANAITLPFSAAGSAKLDAEFPATLKDVTEPWNVTSYTRLQGFRDGEKGCRALVTAPNGNPLLISCPLGKGRVIFALAKNLPWSWAAALLASARGEPLKNGERLIPCSPGWGTMTLAALDDNAIATPRWTSREEIINGLKPGDDSDESVAGETFNAALSVPLKLQPGEERTATFVLAWHFPNVERFHHEGNLYARRWPDALAVARHVAANADALWQRTRLYHETLYQSNLPEEFLDAMTSQSVIFRGPTCWWSEDGYFAGFEGCYGCCPLNCTHVWNYAQSHARLFPEVGRNLRVSNFITYLHPDGETSHREHGPHNAFADGHCAVIVAALREHQLSPDEKFLKQIWPGLKKATDWMIEKYDADHDGVPAGQQWNTYDTAVTGANTFIGSQYLAALAAAEKLALVMKDAEAASRWRAVREAGTKNQDAKLWNGEYYIQIPETPPGRDYNNGCASDQLLGQWWAHQLGLGYLYPPERVRKAADAIMRHNFREKFAGFKQDPRRYIPDDEGGLLICTWPHNDRPKPFMLYSDEVWTGIEYSTAGLMVFEGEIEAARRIVKMARSRYDGRKRDGLNSGPGGNPFNELECGKFYARALSSWSLLIASQGQILDGPKGVLGFRPRWQPADHRSFFTASEGWGLFIQKHKGDFQHERIELRHGKLRLQELVFEIPSMAKGPIAKVTVSDRAIPASLKRDGTEVRLALAETVCVAEGETVEVALRW